MPRTTGARHKTMRRVVAFIARILSWSVVGLRVGLRRRRARGEYTDEVIPGHHREHLIGGVEHDPERRDAVNCHDDVQDDQAEQRQGYLEVEADERHLHRLLALREP